MPAHVAPNDIILKAIGELGAHGVTTYRALQFSGDGVSGISNAGRLIMCNMAVEYGEIYEDVQEGEHLQIDPSTGTIRIREGETEYSGSKLPDSLLEVVADGGLIPHLLVSRRSKGDEGVQ